MTVSTAESSPPSRLPVWRIAKAGYSTLFRNFGAFLTVAAVAAGLSTLLAALVASEDTGITFLLLHIVLDTLLIALFELAWFRYLLLGSTAFRPRLLPRPERRLLPFMGYATLLLLPFLPALFVLDGVVNATDASRILGIVLVVLLYLVAVYLSLRFSLVYLWIAVDAPGRLGKSWRATRRNGLRLLLALILVAAPLIVFLFGSGYLAAMFAPLAFEKLVFGDPEGWLLWSGLLFEQAISYLFYGLSCAVLVQAFQHLTGWVSDQREILERFE